MMTAYMIFHWKRFAHRMVERWWFEWFQDRVVLVDPIDGTTYMSQVLLWKWQYRFVLADCTWIVPSVLEDLEEYEQGRIAADTARVHVRNHRQRRNADHHIRIQRRARAV